MADLAVVIVTWNVRALVLEALSSLFEDLQANGPSAEVYVVDSASADGTPKAIADVFPQVKLIASKENLGFARGNNLAMQRIGFGDKSADGHPKAVYLLNPDTITQPGATRMLFDTLMATPKLGLVGAQLAYADGSFQHSAFHFPGLRQLWVEFFPVPGRLIENPFNGRYPRTLYEAGRPFAIDFPLGATFMVKRETIQQTGMFDEQFFMYCEEIDWAWRIHKAGWSAQCVPLAKVVHLGGQSTAQVRPRSVVDLWTSRLRLYRKHYPAWKALIARLIVALGMRRRAGRIEASPDLLDAYHVVYNMARHQ
jgi:N-acetylglucosaminyl-diphospho-decaprenol L-rhamnosyltransferase